MSTVKIKKILLNEIKFSQIFFKYIGVQILHIQQKPINKAKKRIQQNNYSTASDITISNICENVEDYACNKLSSLW